MNHEAELQESVEYLGSSRALHSIDADPYWPKWDSPWWHMLLLHEMGRTGQIPQAIVEGYVAALDRYPVKIFPIHPEEIPKAIDYWRDTLCHCFLGNVYRVLAAWGVDVDGELPWIRAWFIRYQMADGGLTCDNDAYLVKDEVPSSMVGTIAAFEAMVLHTRRPWNAEDEAFLAKGAEFLMGRRLMHGSPSKHNANERVSAEKWTKLCFPRFYLYDTLRGLSVLLAWAEKTNQTIPVEAVRDVVMDLDRRFPDGKVRIERQSYEGVGTILQSPSGEWIRRQPATFFPLLSKVSTVGEVSPFLSRQWEAAKAAIAARSELRGLLQ
jgi:hypothetical protein